ncbi:MAG: Cro/Cl family transcriptional regulator [Pseudomonadales bacterium]|nr:Cro/Cl family transcriptional regulator [Pseudomonadales bacterium]
MDIHEIRKSNLLLLLAGRKKAAAATKWEMSPSHLSQILSDKTEKNLGDDVARRIEVNEGLPRGWIDSAQHSASGDSYTEGSSNTEPGPPITTAPRRIEIMGTAQLGDGGFWEGLDAAEGWVETYSRDENAYALRLKGDSMAPAIRDGWIAVCEPGHRLVPGEYVKITLRDGRSMVKELLFENSEAVSVMSINSAHGRHNFEWGEITDIHYVGAILPPSKVLCWI